MSVNIVLMVLGLLCWAGSQSLVPPQPQSLLLPQQVAQNYALPQLVPAPQQFLLQQQPLQYFPQQQLQQYFPQQQQLQQYLPQQQVQQYLPPQQFQQYVQQYASPPQYYRFPAQYTVPYTQPQQQFQYGVNLPSQPQYSRVFSTPVQQPVTGYLGQLQGAASGQQEPALTSNALFTSLSAPAGVQYRSSNSAFGKVLSPGAGAPALELAAPAAPTAPSA